MPDTPDHQRAALDLCPSDQDALRCWCSARRDRDGGPTALLVAAHPDDETIGAGIRLGHNSNIWVLHLTDGSPRDPADASAAGCSTRGEYAVRRRRELESAMDLAGLPRSRLGALGIVDGEAAEALPELTSALVGILAALEPQVVVTHPYEGGHPDHDAAAFAVRHACDLLSAQRRHPPSVLEMTSYHDCCGALRTGEFLSAGDGGVLVPLTPGDAARKRRMLECFVTQRGTLAPFGTGAERFRLAPRYDFERPPHSGPLHYEAYPWGVRVADWIGLVQEARRVLGFGM